MNEAPVGRRQDEKENFSSNDGSRNGIFYGWMWIQSRRKDR